MGWLTVFIARQQYSNTKISTLTMCQVQIKFINPTNKPIGEIGRNFKMIEGSVYHFKLIAKIWSKMFKVICKWTI